MGKKFYHVSEMKEFANFSADTQRYIRRSLDIGLRRADARKQWARNEDEFEQISYHICAYVLLEDMRKSLPAEFSVGHIQPIFGQLVQLSAFDLGQLHLPSFSSYRFLYERLLGATVRPWLPGSFVAAATFLHIPSENRKIMLQSITEREATTSGWVKRQPVFFPEWVEKVKVS